MEHKRSSFYYIETSFQCNKSEWEERLSDDKKHHTIIANVVQMIGLLKQFDRLLSQIDPDLMYSQEHKAVSSWRFHDKMVSLASLWKK